MSDSSKVRKALVGDFGGTHARVATVDISQARPQIAHIREYPSHAFPKAADVLARYLLEVPLDGLPPIAVIAAAGPITNGEARFTNLGWTLSEAELQAMGFAQARLLNDFEALALASQHLKAEEYRELGPAREGVRDATLAVIGPGTGFGASALVRSGGVAVALAAEGGHVSFAPEDEVERQVLAVLARKIGHVSVERIVSGPGLENLHDALNEIEGRPCESLDPAEITRRALAGEPFALRTLERFSAILGSVAGNFALSYGARGGVYIAGGVAAAILPVLEKSAFRERFEAKGRFAQYLNAIPTRIILQQYTAFLGAGELARQLATGG